MRSLKELRDLSGRKALVTGGGGHIGYAVAEALVESGATVALLDLDQAACGEKASTLCRIRSRSAVAFSCDLADERATRRAIREVASRLAGLDVLIHCAAFVGTTEFPNWAVDFESQAVGAWEAAMRVNLTSAFVMIQEAREFLAQSGRGSVIFFSSIYGVVGPDMSLYADTSMASPAAYAASKGGVIQLARYLATVLAPAIRVNVISPGGVERNQPEAFRQRYISRTPLERMAREEDVKGAVAYLASDLSAYVTGQNLLIDGGWTIW